MITYKRTYIFLDLHIMNKQQKYGDRLVIHPGGNARLAVGLSPNRNRKNDCESKLENLLVQQPISLSIF